MKVYITQYALTKGIQEKEVKVSEYHPDVVSAGIFETYHKPYWYIDRQEAIEHAEVMRKKKIDSLKKQIKRLEDLKFE